MGNPSPFKGKQHSPEAKTKLAKAHIGKDYLTERGRQTISQAGTNRVFSEETRRKISSTTKGWRARIKSNPEQLARFTAHQRESLRKTMIKKWQDPDFVAKMVASWQKSPTKPERQVEAVLRKNLPEFEYNGDGRLGVTLGGLTPDFVNVDGKKELIEVFGDYYHSPEVIGDAWRRSELGKIMIYNSLGWRCLVIWEHELKQLTEDEIIWKVKMFFGSKKCPQY